MVKACCCAREEHANLKIDAEESLSKLLPACCTHNRSCNRCGIERKFGNLLNHLVANSDLKIKVHMWENANCLGIMNGKQNVQLELTEKVMQLCGRKIQN